MAKRFLSNIRINDAYTFPASDGTNNQVIKTDGSGNLSFGQLATDSASVMYKDTFTGDGSTSVFSLANALNDEVQSNIYIDGVYQSKSTYSVSGTAITFSTAPLSGHEIEVISTTGINSGPTAIYTDTFTANGSTTAFTLGQTVHSENQTIVFLNGVYQFKGTYTLSGTTLTLDTAPSNGVSIEVMSIGSAYSGGDILYDHDFTSAGLMTSNGSGVYSITANNSANWNTAYGWGDHGLSAQDKTDIGNLSGTNTGDQDLSSYATQSYVGTQISNLVDSSPATLNTLNELAAALGDDPNFATTTATSIGLKAPLASPSFTGVVTIPGAISAGANGGLRIHSSGTKFFNVTAANAARNNIMDIGAADAKFKDLYLGGKILVGTGATAAATINAYSTAVSTGLYSALRVIEHGSASSYWDIGATNAANTLLNFYHNGSTTPKIIFTHVGGATFAGQVSVGNYAIPSDHQFQIAHLGQSYARFALTNSQTGNGSSDGLIFQMENLNSIIKNQENGSLAFGTNGRETDLYINSSGSINIGSRRAALPSNFGYSSSYKVLILGSSGANYQTDAVTLSLGVDVTGNPSGAYNGNGREIIIRNEGAFISPNAANNGYNTILSWNSSGQPYFSQNVGIGVTSPGAQLDVVGPSSGSAILKLQRNGVGAYQYFVTDIGSGAQQLFCDAQQADSGFVFRTRDSGNATITALYIAPSGNVGIGTATPSKLLELSGPGGGGGTLMRLNQENGSGSSGPTIDFGYSGQSWRVGANVMVNGDFTIYDTANSQKLIIINNSGNVGIGTTLPKAKLDVDGDVNTTGYLANTLEFSTYFGSGTTVIATLNGSFENGTTAVASIEYVGLYAYAGTSNTLGIIMASTRRSNNNTAWSDVNDETVHVAGAASQEPTLYWDNGLLKITVGSSVQISCRIRITYHGNNTGLTRNHSA